MNTVSATLSLYLAAALGGAAGTVLRYGVTRFWRNWLGLEAEAIVFPWATFGVNVIGALLIGYLWSSSWASAWSPFWKVAVFTGMLGGLTTFSTFMLEFAVLIQEGGSRTALLYLLSSLIVGVMAVFAGLWLGTRFSA